MKKYILLVVSFFSFNATAVELNQELIKNGDFSRGLDFWRIESPSQATDYGREKNFITEVNGTLYMNASPPVEDGYIHTATANQCVAIGEGKEFKLSATFTYDELSEASYVHRINVIWYETLNCSGGGQYGMYIEPKNILGVQNIERGGFISSLNAKAVRVEITQTRKKAMTSGHWDNVSLVPTKMATQLAPRNELSMPLNENLLKNPAFDTNADSWHLYNSATWVATDGDQQLGAIKKTLVSDNGSAGVGAFDQCVNLSTHRYFTVGGSFKIDDASTQMGGGRLRVVWYEKDDCKGAYKIDANNVDPKQTRGWQRLSIPLITSPEGSRSILVETIQSIKNQGTFTAMWDDLYLKAINP